ncbi:hypothetical protein [Streptomyces fagopyri]
MERKTEMRKLSTAERHVSRLMGRPDVTEVEVETTSAADLIAGRLRDRGVPASRKPAGMDVADWYGQRARERNEAERRAQAAAWGTGAEPEDEETEDEVEEEPQASAGETRTQGGWGFRPGGGMFLRTDGGGIVA